MCECGCVSNDVNYILPGPGVSFYVITLRGHCLNCCDGSSVVVEKMIPGSFGYEWFQNEDTKAGDFPLEEWAGDRLGQTIVTGMRQHEFVNALKGQLVGNAGVDDDGKIDEIAAETILEELYAAAQTKPYI